MHVNMLRFMVHSLQYGGSKEILWNTAMKSELSDMTRFLDLDWQFLIHPSIHKNHNAASTQQHEKPIEISEISIFQLRKKPSIILRQTPRLILSALSIDRSTFPLPCRGRNFPIPTTNDIENGMNEHPTLALLLWQLSKSSLVVTHAVGVAIPLTTTTTIKGKLQLRATVRT